MTEHVTPPRTDDRPLMDVMFGLLGYQAVLVAQSVKLFPALAERPLTLDELCTALVTSPRATQAVLHVLVSLGFLQMQDGRYALTPVSEDYLLESSPSYYGAYFDFSTGNMPSTYEFAGMKRTLLTTEPSRDQDLYDLLQYNEMTRRFTRAMHGHSVGSSLAWPNVLGLSDTKVMLDIGGGSGVHAISATQHAPELRAIVFDTAPVCEIAEEYVAQAHLSDRISTLVGDMWDSPFPEADLHFYAEIYHNWLPEQCDFLTKKSFNSLTPGGRIAVHEILLNDDKQGPFSSAAYSLGMALWTHGQQFSGAELVAMLTDAGFVDVEVKPSFGYWSLVIGRKPI